MKKRFIFNNNKKKPHVDYHHGVSFLHRNPLLYFLGVNNGVNKLKHETPKINANTDSYFA